MVQVISEPLEEKTVNKNFVYMLFVLGIFLSIVGLYLYTYTAVVMVNNPTNVFGITYNIPTAEQIQPYQTIGTGMILFAILLILSALIGTQKE